MWIEEREVDQSRWQLHKLLHLVSLVKQVEVVRDLLQDWGLWV